jgi:hypothetical protein
MNLTIAPNGVLQIDDARIIYRNFRGEGGKYNHEGDRNFAVIIPSEDMAEALAAEGWNVKIKPPRDDGDDPFMYLSVKVRFNDRGPHIYLRSGNASQKLDEENVGMLDRADISSVSMDIRPYDWEVNGGSGRAAYLLSMEAIQNIDRFAARYAEEESPEE